MIEDVEVRDAGDKGKGVFARRDFASAEFIFRRRHGRVVQNDAISSLSAEDQRHLCEIDFTRSAVLLAPGCYLNHACDPNAMRSGVKVFAWREIRKDEEITIDYRLNAFNNERWQCNCGSHTCTGEVVSSFVALPTERQHLYLPHAPAFIKREYRRRHQASRSPDPVNVGSVERPLRAFASHEAAPADAVRLVVRGTACGDEVDVGVFLAETVVAPWGPVAAHVFEE